jgi:hypothetical protein
MTTTTTTVELLWLVRSVTIPRRRRSNRQFSRRHCQLCQPLVLVLTWPSSQSFTTSGQPELSRPLDPSIRSVHSSYSARRTPLFPVQRKSSAVSRQKPHHNTSVRTDRLSGLGSERIAQPRARPIKSPHCKKAAVPFSGKAQHNTSKEGISPPINPPSASTSSAA